MIAEKLKQSRGLRYLLVGGSVYVLELIVIVLAQNMGATSVEAVASSFTIGLIVSFLLQKLFTFGDRRMKHRIVLAQVFAVCALVLVNFWFTLFVTKIFENVFSPVVTRTVALGITTIWNFYLYRTRIFNAHGATDDTIVG
jgi:putative flippase GtrA